MSNQQIIDNLESVWRSVDGLCTTFAEREWKTPTDCPGWSVQDQVSHMIGIESQLLARPEPNHTPRDLSHVRNEQGKRNEVAIDWRRNWAGARVLEEFRQVTGERLRVLRAMTAEDFSAECQTPIGPGTVRDLLGIRLFDCCVHEQDIRRAVGRPGHLEGPAAEDSIERVSNVMPYVIGRKVGAPDGTTVVFDVTGPTGRILSIGVEGGRARLTDAPPTSPDLRLTMDSETFACLGCGRWEPGGLIASGRVRFEGDRQLGEAIVAQMNFLI